MKTNKVLKISLIAFLVVGVSFLLVSPVSAINDQVTMYRGGPPTGGDDPVQPPQTIPWGIARINAIDAAAQVDMTGVDVAILDTGMDLDHPDLAALYVWGYDFVNDDTIPDDDNGHGTHCAGTIAGLNNDIGVIGVAPEVDLYILKVLDKRGSGDYLDIANAIIMATNGPDGVPGNDDDADVISMSLGGPSGTVDLENAVNYALSYNVVIVCATGNEGADTPSYPAAYPGVIKVGATDINDAIASFSNRGETILAPGVSIFSTYPGGSYATMSGTSMATPHVAGVVALAWAAHPSYTGVQIKNLVEGSADAVGIVNALAVV